MKIIAELTTWGGKKVRNEIKREWAQDIADAVSGQFYLAKNNLIINGSNYCHVNIYEVAE